MITGDRVTVSGTGTTVEPGKGRSEITFAAEDIGERIRVVPSDAFSLLREGRLDPRLFDVTTLLEAGYDDRRADLPLIVAHSGKAAEGRIRSQLTTEGTRLVRDLTAVDGLAVRVDKTYGTRFWDGLTTGGATRTLAGGVTKVWLDGLAKLSLNDSVQQIGARDAWQKGLTGAGVKVAVLDTGIDAAHPDLAGRVAAQENFTEDPDGRDVVGHGTHVAATIAGSGSTSAGKYRGVAPGATLLDGKVCGVGGWCEESSILAGMQWAAEHGARVANMSLGARDTPELDLLEQAVQRLTSQYGTLFVVSAGNGGKVEPVSSPGSADAALSVGAVTKSDALAEFSSRGPRVGDAALKPDITAPGVDITAARSGTSPGEGAYVAQSGTSMAAPHVAASAAILAEQHPGWQAGTLKAALMAGARPNPALGVFAQGAGRLDVARATEQSVTTEPGAVSFGRQSWPHTDDEPVTRKLVYHNAGAAPVTLRLSARAVDAQGGPLPVDLFTVTPGTIIVPAHGQAEVSVTADTRVNVTDGHLGGYLIATGDGDVSVSTPLAVDKEIESYDLTLRHLDRDGQPTSEYFTAVARIDVPAEDWAPIFIENGQSTVTLRLPKGRWLIDSRSIFAEHVTMLVHPGLELSEARTVDLDARLGREISVNSPTPSATLLQSEASHQGTLPDGAQYTFTFLGRSFERMLSAQLGPERTYDGVLTKVAGQWADGADAYRLSWFVRGRIPTGFSRKVDPADLTAVRTDYAEHRPGAEGAAASWAQPPDGKFSGYLASTHFALPFTQTEYLNTDEGIRWQRQFRETVPSGESSYFYSPITRYERKRAYAERWNRGVFGPALVGDAGVTRTGDTIAVDVPLYGDGAGRMGRSTRAEGHIALYRDGQLVADERTLGYIEFEVPSGAARYRLVMEAGRGTPSVLSTRTAIAWTFRSGQGRDGTPSRPPLSTVQFSPSLDSHNAAPAGTAYTVPVTIRPQPGTAATKVRDLTVDVSYDDGSTWSAAPVKRSGTEGTVVLRHPPGAGFVSLRAGLTDVAGNTMNQTIIRAYRITPGS
ncbi:S8 family serine peptidase [Microtetraspora sp. NBRC 13810]|uniref:S8 family serine peptidase n=1 Tax=Microtetraspora sp. NBRC 13810 TaxID=3030990 RepID=UPI0025570CBA|nr:S8 family serine peptidase [Microtetraspora sp. NBRC 13810]